ncbi:MAG: hypothetical protein II207_06925 [Clostridia bacterium]|nr:hypothetical protein [Clostridia bacterium]
MEPICININVEVALSQPTLEVLGKLLAPRPEQLIGFDVQPVQQDPQPEPEQPKKRKGAKKAEAEAEPAPAPAPEPEPEPAPAPAPVEAPASQADDDDLPPDDAPAPVKTPTMEEVRKTIREVREQNVTAGDIQKMLKDKFGVATSAECPAEKRTELIKELKKLVA